MLTKANYLSLNFDKTFSMVFSKRKIDPITNHHVVFDEQEVKSVIGGKLIIDN